MGVNEYVNERMPASAGKYRLYIYCISDGPDHGCEGVATLSSWKTGESDVMLDKSTVTLDHNFKATPISRGGGVDSSVGNNLSKSVSGHFASGQLDNKNEKATSSEERMNERANSSKDQNNEKITHSKDEEKVIRKVLPRDFYTHKIYLDKQGNALTSQEATNKDIRKSDGILIECTEDAEEIEAMFEMKCKVAEVYGDITLFNIKASLKMTDDLYDYYHDRGKTIYVNETFFFYPDQGEKTVVSYEIRESNYYYVVYEFSIFDSDDINFLQWYKSKTSRKGPWLFNTLGELYPACTNAHSYMTKYYIDPYVDFLNTKPPRKLPPKKREYAASWNESTQNAYKKEYQRVAYVTDPNFDWNKYWQQHVIYHITPGIYGGTNDFSNLIPLPPEIHDVYTLWWERYDKRPKNPAKKIIDCSINDY